MNKTFITLLAIAVVVIGGWWMFKQSGTEVVLNVPTDQGIAVSEPNASAPVEVKTVQEPVSQTVTVASKVKGFTISAGSYFFNPKVMAVNKGDTVRITLINSGGFHDLKIDEFGVATKQLQNGQSDTVTFVADKAGSFEYYCSVGSHRAMGMKGTLTVK